MSLLKSALMIAVLIAVVIAAPRKPGRGNRRQDRGKPLDEILALVGDLKHGKANLGGRNPASLRRDNGRAVVREYDILVPSLEATVQDGSPPPPPARSGSGGRGRNKNRNKKNRRRSRNNRSKRHATPHASQHWPNGEVAYQFDSSITQSTRDAFANAIAEYNTYTCITWTQRTNEADYVLVIDGGSGTGCSSYVGKTGGAQTLNLRQPGCTSLKTIIHEMLHALGVYHQHTRPDRDGYVTINSANIQSGMEHNFDKRTDTNTYLTNYDYRSVMHYGRHFFSTNGNPTMILADSNYDSIVGNAPTIGYRDIMLLTRMYDCTGTLHGNCAAKSCPTEGFQGHDCSCKCEQTNGDYSVPAINCAEVCTEVDTPCDCTSWPQSCDSLPNSICNSVSEACECETDYTKHNGVCTLTSSIECTELNTNCKCSLNSGSCLVNLSPAVCDTNTDMCICTSQQIEQNGECIDANSVSCDAPGKVCGCSSKGSSACSAVSDSSCDPETNACTCNTNYYNADGDCTLAPSCDTLGSACHCEVQGSSACSGLENTACDTSTGACECPTSVLYEVQSGQCKLKYISDGSMVAPFTPSPDTATYDVSWVSISGADNPYSSNFGIPANSYYLFADGDTGNAASMETDLIAITGGEPMCVKAGILLDKAKLIITVNYGNGWTSWSQIPDQGYPEVYFLVTFTFNGPSADTTAKFSIRAEYDGSSPGESWHVKLDPLIIEPC